MIQADIVQTVRCSDCKKLRADDSNNWFEVAIVDSKWLIGHYTIPITKNKAYLCGVEHLFRFMNEQLRRTQ